MIRNNREFSTGFVSLGLLGIVLTIAGFSIHPACGVFALLAWVSTQTVFTLTEYRRYRKLQKLAADLEALLQRGTALPLQEYQEGELSILACQIQKIALSLTEAAQAVKKDKLFLADSLANISHQLRTPLTAMNLTGSMLSTRQLSQERRLELAKELRSLLARTDWLVEALLKLSKLDAGTVNMASERVSAASLLQRSAGPLAIPMELREQSLKLVYGEETFQGDLIWTSEALGNILKNCMEHTPTGGSITVTAQENALYTQFTVEDTGPGFAPEDIPHLFERFYKGKNASQESYGIGLALARRVIAAQGGTVQACNGPTGAKFVIKFYKQTV